jgi:hypothetical protein
MATRYVRVRTSYVSSDASDYSRPRIDAQFEDELTPDEVYQMEIECATGGTTIYTDPYASVTKLLIQNDDATNFVTAVYRTGGGGATDQTIAIPAGEHVVLTDVTAATNPVLTADTAVVTCRVFITGT